jgi:hypothetical protein
MSGVDLSKVNRFFESKNLMAYYIIG